jgi:hypothetical protein
MRPALLSAGLLAAALSVGASSGRAADLDYGPLPSDRYSSAYEDPRYRDIYGSGSTTPYEQRYYQPTPPPAPVPPAYVYQGDARGYPPPSPQYAQGYPNARYGNTECLPRSEIQRRLLNEGWRDFHDLDFRDDVAVVRARRPSGDLYRLKVDRCSGDIVKAGLIERGGYGPYAYDSGPRRQERPYY